MSQQDEAEHHTAGDPNHSDSLQHPSAPQPSTHQQPPVSQQPQGPLRGTFTSNTVQEDRRLLQAMANASRGTGSQQLSRKYDQSKFQQQIEHAELLHRNPPGPQDGLFATNHRMYAEVAWECSNHWSSLPFKLDEKPEFKAVTGHEPVLWFRKPSSSGSSATCLDDHNPIRLTHRA